MYLAMDGHKVINIPLVPGVPLPTELEKIPQGKIVGLIQGSRIWDRGDAVQYVDHLMRDM
jgi:regulator of PEP synthase PpsR (kinase-PPPase family)